MSTGAPLTQAYCACPFSPISSSRRTLAPQELITASFLPIMRLLHFPRIPHKLAHRPSNYNNESANHTPGPVPPGARDIGRPSRAATSARRIPRRPPATQRGQQHRRLERHQQQQHHQPPQQRCHGPYHHHEHKQFHSGVCRLAAAIGPAGDDRCCDPRHLFLPPAPAAATPAATTTTKQPCRRKQQHALFYHHK